MSGSGGPKVKAFNINPLAKKLAVKDKFRKEEEDKAAAEAYEEFLASFEEPAKHGKLFVRGSVINAGSGEEKTTSQTGKLYKPPKLSEATRRMEESRQPQQHDLHSPSSQSAAAREKAKKKEKEKKKSNLELFKEELKIIQEEREERYKMKGALKDHLKKGDSDIGIRLGDDYRYPSLGSFDTGDPNTTNLYLGNLNPKMTEQELCEIFGRYGPLASVKIMWPRSQEERQRKRNCGFVAYMNRKDGERAIKHLSGQEVMGFEMKMGWGKAVPIPPHPVSLLCLIHRMIEFVVREGPMFEAMIMNRELNNPMFRFLFENQSPAHVYYRWRLFSILQGDHPNRWRTQEFRMFEGGSLWKPPPMNPYLQGMPPELVEKEQEESPSKDDNRKGSLSDSQRDKLEDMLRALTPERPRIMEAMIYCIEHADAAEEIVDCVTQSLSILETPLHKKVARLYLISDILHNCSVKVANASFFRKGFQVCLPEIFKEIHEAFNSIEGRLKAEQFKQRVMSCFRAWEDWAIYPNDFLIRLQNIFLGLVPSTKPVGLVPSCEDQSTEGEGSPPPLVKDDLLEDVDGVPLVAADTDLDGLPLVGPVADPDLDGVPLGVVEDPDLDGQPLDVAPLRRAPPAKFVPSKWETVDPETVSQQAVTTSKWDLLDQGEEEEEEEDNSSSRRGGSLASPAVHHPTTSGASSIAASMDDDIDGEPLEEGSPRDDSQDSMPAMDLLKTESGEERRAKLREIELKVMKFQDELESGKRPRKQGLTISAQVEHYRQKLIRKDQEKSSGGSSERRKERSKRSRSLSRSRSRSPILSPLVVRSGVSQRSSGKLSPVTSEGKSRRSRSPRSPRTSRSHRSRSPKKRR
ncbi:hypothetical protein V5799_034412 [Amblyomma americanum]|uniref:Splicing regulator n=1 Tax=Amblyomma americanum TaxID=6943 RepID=A0AAQ4DKI9_AMBAM